MKKKQLAIEIQYFHLNMLILQFNIVANVGDNTLENKAITFVDNNNAESAAFSSHQSNFAFRMDLWAIL